MADKRIVCPDADPVLGQFVENLDMETSHHRIYSRCRKCSKTAGQSC